MVVVVEVEVVVVVVVVVVKASELFVRVEREDDRSQLRANTRRERVESG